MKRLIRNRQTKEYLSLDGTWTRDSSSARNFHDIREVVKTEQQYQLENIELVLLMGDKPSRYDVVIPLGISTRKGR